MHSFSQKPIFMFTPETLTVNFQKRLFELIRAKLDPDINLAKRIAELLHVGLDAAYKKISAARILDLIELHILLEAFELHYQDLEISSQRSRLTMLQFVPSIQSPCLAAYLQYLIKALQEVKPVLQGNLLLTLPSLSFFHLAYSPELTSFYAFLLQKHVLNLPDFKHRKFDLVQTDPTLLHLSQSLHEVYFNLPTTEIWQANVLGFLPKQLRYYQEAQLFVQPHTYALLLDKYKLLLQHLEFEVGEGQKYHMHTGAKGASFELYHHELVGGEQAMYAPLSNTAKVWIQTHGLQMLCTTDAHFTGPFYQNLLDLQAKSTYLSGQNEKLVAAFFYRVIQEIDSGY